MVAPVFLQHRPQDLVDVFAALPHRPTQDAFLDGAELPQCSVRAAVRNGNARFEAMRSERPECQRADQAGRLDEDARTASGRHDGALTHHGFERRVELPYLNESDDRASAANRNDVGEGEARRALAQSAIDQLLRSNLGDSLVDAEPRRVGERQNVHERSQIGSGRLAERHRPSLERRELIPPFGAGREVRSGRHDCTDGHTPPTLLEQLRSQARHLCISLDKSGTYEEPPKVLFKPLCAYIRRDGSDRDRDRASGRSPATGYGRMFRYGT